MPEAAVIGATGHYVMKSGKYAGQTARQILNSDPGYLPKFLGLAKNESDILAVKKILEDNPKQAEGAKTAVAVGDVNPESGAVKTEPDIPADADKGYVPPNPFPDGWYMLKSSSLLVQARKMTKQNRKDVNLLGKPVFEQTAGFDAPLKIEVGMWCLVMPIGDKQAVSDETFKTSYEHSKAFDGFE